jgi:hypothetical protein
MMVGRAISEGPNTETIISHRRSTSASRMQVALVAASRIGVYDRLPGVDVEKFSAAVSGSGLLGYIDNITGGSISNVGVFSLGIIPAINASIFLQARLPRSSNTSCRASHATLVLLRVSYPKMIRAIGIQPRVIYTIEKKRKKKTRNTMRLPNFMLYC